MIKKYFLNEGTLCYSQDVNSLDSYVNNKKVGGRELDSFQFSRKSLKSYQCYRKEA